jgi:hypothetical protein
VFKVPDILQLAARLDNFAQASKDRGDIKCSGEMERNLAHALANSTFDEASAILYARTAFDSCGDGFRR